MMMMMMLIIVHFPDYQRNRKLVKSVDDRTH